eukprot:TRINITY_DN13064_c1_g1_i1.p1 TRINITY_DN13064_c1_g1~~TRINITY_DN13064_c1_g1_i1.p1  ORF type:complete len:136 (+),score=13.27 TRINITY_DN13064_c1_g1_i1:124-531(+)
MLGVSLMLSHTLRLSSFFVRMERLKRLNVLGIQWRKKVVVQILMLRALCCHNMILEACKLICLMDERCFSPNLFTCSAFLGGLLKAGHPRYVNELLNDILAKGCNVDAAICNIYFNGLCQENRSREVFSLVKDMT